MQGISLHINETFYSGRTSFIIEMEINMKKIITLLLVLSVTLTACAPNADEPASLDPSYPNASYPNPSYPNSLIQNDYAPQPSDTSMIHGTVFLDSTELLTLESSPLQFTLHLTGNLPTPCDQLRVAVNPPDTDNKIVVDVYSVSAPDKVCAQVLAPFDTNISLGSFPTGTYTLWINGEMVAEFQS
jgi:hypothetical protein